MEDRDTLQVLVAMPFEERALAEVPTEPASLDEDMIAPAERAPPESTTRARACGAYRLDA